MGFIDFGLHPVIEKAPLPAWVNHLSEQQVCITESSLKKGTSIEMEELSKKPLKELLSNTKMLREIGKSVKIPYLSRSPLELIGAISLMEGICKKQTGKHYLPIFSNVHICINSIIDYFSSQYDAPFVITQNIFFGGHFATQSHLIKSKSFNLLKYNHSQDLNHFLPDINSGIVFLPGPLSSLPNPQQLYSSLRKKKNNPHIWIVEFTIPGLPSSGMADIEIAMMDLFHGCAMGAASLVINNPEKINAKKLEQLTINLAGNINLVEVLESYYKILNTDTKTLHQEACKQAQSIQRLLIHHDYQNLKYVDTIHGFILQVNPNLDYSSLVDLLMNFYDEAMIPAPAPHPTERKFDHLFLNAHNLKNLSNHYFEDLFTNWDCLITSCKLNGQQDYMSSQKEVSFFPIEKKPHH